MKLLVCGGRDYLDARTAYNVLDFVRKPVTTVISGMAKGADSIGASWAESRGIAVDPYPANWDAYGKAAGPMRNTQMLVEGSPDFVVAFPGGKGTEHMLSIAENSDIPTTRVIFVFGSNLKGVHGAGAAKLAREQYQAEMGIGLGHTGWAYALPTKDEMIKTLSLREIAMWYENFLADIEDSPDLYYLTPFGTGLAGYTVKEIAAATIEKNPPPFNVVLAPTWNK